MKRDKNIKQEHCNLTQQFTGAKKKRVISVGENGFVAKADETESNDVALTKYSMQSFIRMQTVPM